MRHPCAKAVAVYRMYDAQGILLYVGQSIQPWVRPMQKLGEADWPLKIASMTVQWLPNRDEALAEEERLIRDLCPPYNIQHNKAAKQKRTGCYGGLVLARWLENKGMTRLEFCVLSRLSLATVNNLIDAGKCPIARTAATIRDVTDGEIPASVWDRGGKIRNWRGDQAKAIRLLREVGIDAVSA